MAWKDVLSSLFSFGRFWGLFQGGMRPVDPAAHTIKSHGAALARNHLCDWLILLLLLVIEVILSDVYDLHHSILGLLFAVLITAVLTDAIKDAVGRPRPDFFWRCFPDGVEVYDKRGGVVCHGRVGDIKEGHKSFPSGHTSWSFAGLGFLSLYLCGKIKAFDRGGHVAKLCIVFLPLLAASLVGVSRVDDYWHHWQDVFAGGLLGLVVAIFCYTQFFPPPYNDEGWGPYAYFQAMEEDSRANSNRNQNNAPSMQGMEVRVVNQEARRNVGGLITHFPDLYNHSPTLDAMELGRK